jgi:hypothetical protein
MAIRENNIDEMHIEILEELKAKTAKRFGLKSPPFEGGVLQSDGVVNTENYQEETIVIDDEDDEIEKVHKKCGLEEVNFKQKIK